MLWHNSLLRQLKRLKNPENGQKLKSTTTISVQKTEKESQSGHFQSEVTPFYHYQDNNNLKTMTKKKCCCKKWTLSLVLSLLLSSCISKSFFVQGAPEKLTQEQVLEELGVKIET